MSLRAATGRGSANTLAADAFADTDAQLTAADSLIVPLEFQLYGYCRCRRVSDVCEPGGYEPPMVKNAQQFPG